MLPSLYVHVPFCSSRCTYCDFYSRATSPSLIQAASESWLLAIERHLEALMRRFNNDGFRTVYIGGGTPSWLPLDILARALSLIGKRALASGQAPLEWTIEANPEDIDESFLDILEDSGVDRLSIGVQSLEDDARILAGRRGSSRLIQDRLESVATRWKGRLSCDLMYGLPGQTAQGLVADLSLLSGLGLGHISLYELTLEPASALFASVQDGRVCLPDEDERADAYDAATEALNHAGFSRYEVSNWALAGEESIHNEVYWEMGNWLALGPSGVGNIGLDDASFMRMENVADEQVYGLDPAVSCVETIVRVKDAAFESLMTSLRTARGCNLVKFKERFLIDPIVIFGPLHTSFPNLIRMEGSSWKATQRGLDTLNVPLVAALRHADEYYTMSDEDSGVPQS